MKRAPLARVGRPPTERPVGTPPNPRQLKPLRHVGGGGLKDLFEIFPDLPRPPRTAGPPAVRAFPHFVRRSISP
jgi:hypothetical protein